MKYFTESQKLYRERQRKSDYENLNERRIDAREFAFAEWTTTYEKDQHKHQYRRRPEEISTAFTLNESFISNAGGSSNVDGGTAGRWPHMPDYASDSLEDVPPNPELGRPPKVLNIPSKIHVGTCRLYVSVSFIVLTPDNEGKSNAQVK